MLEKFNGQRWPAMTFQLTILAIITSLLLKNIVNSYIILSFILVLSTFALQTTSVRFLWLYPVWQGDPPNPRLCVTTNRADTYFLKFYILSSSVFLAIGICYWAIFNATDKMTISHFEWLLQTLKFWDLCLLEIVIYILVVFGIVFPLIFFFYWNRRIKNLLQIDQAQWLRQLNQDELVRADDNA
ncbi:MAG: hypothetical protein H8D55_02000 [Deltaproteobacteria bacterium]|nr:hypothetical protein [Deltaproteobacteria bacterium]